MPLLRAVLEWWFTNCRSPLSGYSRSQAELEMSEPTINLLLWAHWCVMEVSNGFLGHLQPLLFTLALESQHLFISPQITSQEADLPHLFFPRLAGFEVPLGAL